MTESPGAVRAGRSRGFVSILLSGLAAFATAAGAQLPQAAATAGDPAYDEPAPPGVANLRRAWQNWVLNCQGCHRPDGSGSASTAPALAHTVSKFLTVRGGREYLGRVPGVATSPVGNAELAELMNWIFWRFDKEHIPAGFRPFTADEIGPLRAQPLRLEASRMRAELLQSADQAAVP